mgnify:CR=1 FL=1
MLLITFLFSMGIQNAHAEPVTVFNRSNPEYNVDKFIGKRTENSCRLSLISYFENDGCMRAISRGDLEIEYLKCADGNNHQAKILMHLKFIVVILTILFLSGTFTR